MATDRLTQLQDLVHNLEELFAIALDELRTPVAAPPPKTGFEGTPGQAQEDTEPAPEDVGKLFSRLIVQRGKAIDQFIGFLPTAESSEAKQREHLAELQAKNQAARESLETSIQAGEKLLAQVRAALQSIVSSHYRLVTEAPVAGTSGHGTADSAAVGVVMATDETGAAGQSMDVDGGVNGSPTEGRGTKRARTD